GNGGATDTGVTATSIKIGGTFFNGGYLDKYSQVAEQAASAYFKYVNDHGGVFGRKIEYVPCDTAGTADGTQGCLRKLANDDKVFAMGPSLDFNLDTVPTFLADKKLPWVGSSGLYPEEHKSPLMFPSQIPGADVGVHIASFAKKTLGAATIGVSYLTDGAGPSCTESIKNAASRLGYQVVVTVENSQTQGDMTQQVLKVKQANPDTVLFCNDPINNVKFIQAAGRVGYKPPKGWVGGFVAVEDVPKSMGAAASASTGSPPSTSSAATRRAWCSTVRSPRATSRRCSTTSTPRPPSSGPGPWWRPSPRPVRSSPVRACSQLWRR
ncbi:MAG TPA: ABC transporter substrate-binding protein, partial [Acidimicrobiia bacterium]|nr:ABC transporter substrate-binding protein [Acidimicrobiia bacterium]